MAAYFIVDLEVADRDRFKDYAEAVPSTISAYGGRYLVAGGSVETIEGDWLRDVSLLSSLRVVSAPGSGGCPRSIASLKCCVEKRHRQRYCSSTAYDSAV